MSRWATVAEVRRSRREGRERLKEEREKRMDDLVRRCSELGYRAEPMTNGTVEIRSVREPR